MGSKIRNFPRNSLEESLVISQKIQDEMAAKPFNRLLLAESIGVKPGSSNFIYLLSASYKYGLTEGTEKAEQIKLTQLGEQVTQTTNPPMRKTGLQKAALNPNLFSKFYNDYNNKKLPSDDMISKILVSNYGVDKEFSDECAKLIINNGRFADIIRDIGGSPHVLIGITDEIRNGEAKLSSKEFEKPVSEEDSREAKPEEYTKKYKPILVCHGKKKEPLEKLQNFLTKFQIPFKIVEEEPNLGRPIPDKVKETMDECGSAILIFTCDEKFFDENGKEVWRPSENVVYELGATSYAYKDRVVIFKEKQINFPANFQSIGYIEFEEDKFEEKTKELLNELIGFGLIKIVTSE